MWVIIGIMCIVAMFLISMILKQMIKYEELQAENSYTNYEIESMIQEMNQKLQETKTLQENNFIRVLKNNSELQNFIAEVEYYINNYSIVESHDKIKELLSRQR